MTRPRPPFPRRLRRVAATLALGLGVSVLPPHAPRTASPTLPASSPVQPLVAEAASRTPSPLKKAAASPVGTPRRVIIPRIKVDADLEELGLMADGKLEAPAERLHAGWYALGPKPGERGTAIIDGHLTLHGRRGVFWNLRAIRPGDTVAVIDQNGSARAFRVTGAKLYDVRGADLAEIFNAKDGGTHLRLITCAGVWRKELNHYDKRLVIFTDALPDVRTAAARL